MNSYLHPASPVAASTMIFESSGLERRAIYGPSGEVRMHGVFATSRIPSGSLLYSVPCTEKTTERNRWTIQLTETEHVQMLGETWEFINHACEPNVRLVYDTAMDALHIMTVRDIELNEEVTFCYPSSETIMTEAFDCKCGCAGCFGRVDGFKNLKQAQKSSIAHLILPHNMQYL